jgi:hypothetical protein
MIRSSTSAAAAASAQGSPLIRSGGSPWSRGVIVLLTCAVVVGAASVGAALSTMSALHYVYFDRENLPNLGPFTRFEFPTIGHVYDTNGQPRARPRVPPHHAVRRHPAGRTRGDPCHGGQALLLP